MSMKGNTERAGPRFKTEVPDTPSMTKQAFKNECDVNLIYRRFEETGQIPAGSPPRYGEQDPDFQTAQFALARARSTFEGLPIDIQRKYGSVEQVIEAMQDPDSASELHADGILSAYGILISPDDGIEPDDDLRASQPDSTPSTPADKERSDEGASPEEKS